MLLDWQPSAGTPHSSSFPQQATEQARRANLPLITSRQGASIAIITPRWHAFVFGLQQAPCLEVPDFSQGRLMAIPMQLARIIISEISDNQVVYLQEIDGERQFPILIGIFEATSIDRRVKGDFAPPRPLTHDLIVSVAESLGAVIESVTINELREHTYYAKLHLRKSSGEIVEIDARPSDAIAVAVTYDPPLPIYVSEEVVDEASS